MTVHTEIYQRTVRRESIPCESRRTVLRTNGQIHGGEKDPVHIAGTESESQREAGTMLCSGALEKRNAEIQNQPSWEPPSPEWSATFETR